MNPFKELLNDTVFIERDGRRQGPFRTAVSSKGCSIFEVDLDVIEGDTLLQELPANRFMAYEVQEVSFSQGLAPIPASFELRLCKIGSHSIPTQNQTINIANSTGFQVGNQNSMDLCVHLTQVLEAIEHSPAPEPQKAAAKSKLREFLAHPAVVAVIGSASEALLNRLHAV